VVKEHAAQWQGPDQQQQQQVGLPQLLEGGSVHCCCCWQGRGQRLRAARCSHPAEPLQALLLLLLAQEGRGLASLLSPLLHPLHVQGVAPGPLLQAQVGCCHPALAGALLLLCQLLLVVEVQQASRHSCHLLLLTALA
jgi:hypothetical protein